MKKIIGWGIACFALVATAIDGYLLFLKPNSQANSFSKSSSTNSSNSNTTNSTLSDLQDGTYTGDSTSTEWGDVQVQIIVSSGKITAINVLSYPDSNQKSEMINEQVLPTYKSEALSAQGADIDQVSGATETYKGFTSSLQSAITKSESADTSSLASDSGAA